MFHKHWLFGAILIWVAKSDEISVNRHFRGDIFTFQECGDDPCRNRGTAVSTSFTASTSSSISSSLSPTSSPSACACQCDPSWPVYREDRSVCVDSVHECEMADFVTGSSSEKIPFVFLPLTGQLVYPSATISIPSGSSDGSSVSPICVLSTIEMMTGNGWVDISNITGQNSAPFQLYNDDGKTFLQWLGNESIHQALEGRLLLIHLLCKYNARRIQAPCISLRIAGSPSSTTSIGSPQHNANNGDNGGSLTERDYLAIGICAGFLVMLYIFAMIVFIVIKRKQKKDRRLREQFLQLPAPEGIGFKSSRILGLDEQYLTDLARYQCRSGPCHNGGSGEGDQIGQGWSLTNKWRNGKKSLKQMLQTDAACDINTMMMVNRKMLDAHKKMVENKLQMEVAHSVNCMSAHHTHNHACHGNANTSGHICAAHETRDTPHTCAEHADHGRVCLARNVKNGSKRFFPHLEQIPEESRNNTFKSPAKKADTDSSDGSITTSDIEYKDDINYNSNSQESSTNKSNPRSMDSGIATRSTSPSHEHPSDNETTTTSSQGMYSDNETVDVASSDETESDNDKEDNNNEENSKEKTEPEKVRSPSLSDILNLGHKNLDFLSEIYNTAFSKVPKVCASDAESIYSYNSRTGDYSSLDHHQDNAAYGVDIYRNPRFRRSVHKIDNDNSIVSIGHGVTAVYVSSIDAAASVDGAEISGDFMYTAGDKLRISVPKQEDKVYTDKLTIEVNHEPIVGSETASAESSGNFDPDTLERNLERDRRPTHKTISNKTGEDKLGGVDNSKYFKHNETNTENRIENVDITDSVRYSFRLHDQGLTSNKEINKVEISEVNLRSSKREKDLQKLFPSQEDIAPALPPKLNTLTKL